MVKSFLKRIISNAHTGSDPMGGGLYIFPSMFNHDCSNNSQHWTENSVLNLTLQRDVKKGEEITISYISGKQR